VNVKFDVSSLDYEWQSSGSKEPKIISDGKDLYHVNGQEITPQGAAGPSDPFLVHGKIRSVLKDQMDRIWVTTLDNGLFCYYPEQRATVQYRRESSKVKSLPFDITNPLLIDNSGNLWIGTDGGGITRLDLKPPLFHIFPLNEGEHPFLKDYFVRCLFEDDRGSIWFGTQHNGLCIYSPVDGSVVNYSPYRGDKNFLPGERVSAILKSAQGDIFIGHSQGISIFDEQQGSFTHYSLISYANVPTMDVFKLIQLQNGEIMAGTSMGLFLLSKAPKGYRVIFLQEMNLAPTDILHESDGSLWVTSRYMGLQHFQNSGSEFRNVGHFFEGVNMRSIHRDGRDSHISGSAPAPD
jgi:ligand-binding sensor domain-containing protein